LQTQMRALLCTTMFYNTWEPLYAHSSELSVCSILSRPRDAPNHLSLPAHIWKNTISILQDCSTLCHSKLLLYCLDATVNGVAFLISLSDSSLLVHRNTMMICILILYPIPLLNSSISSNSFLVEMLQFSSYKIMSLQTEMISFLPL